MIRYRKTIIVNAGRCTRFKKTSAQLLNYWTPESTSFYVILRGGNLFLKAKEVTTRRFWKIVQASSRLFVGNTLPCIFSSSKLFNEHIFSSMLSLKKSHRRKKKEKKPISKIQTSLFLQCARYIHSITEGFLFWQFQRFNLQH